jgi:hypothetical protein
MVKTLVLTSENIVPNTGNSVLRYNFPQGGVLLQDEYIAVQQISLYNSVFNISSNLNNNVFSYIWVDGTINQVVMPPSGIHLSLAQLNSYLQSVMVANKHYYTKSGSFVYLLEILVNQSRYSYQINAFETSATIATANGWVLPTGTLTWTNPNNAIMPMLVVPDTDFQDLIGFSAGNYPNATISGAVPNQVQTPVIASPYSVLSGFAPQIEPQTTYLGLCSFVNNKLVIPNQVIVSLTPTEIEFGGLFNIQFSGLAFNKVENGNYNQFTFSFVDTLGERIEFEDPNIMVILVLKNKNDPF